MTMLPSRGGHNMEAVLWSFTLALVMASSRAATGDTIEATCCDSQLMDSAGYVMIETNSMLTTGKEFHSIITRFCTNAEVHVQVWTEQIGPDDTKNYKFKWEQILTPTKENLGPKPMQPIVFATPVTFTAKDRLALFAGETHALPIPFVFDGNNRNYTFHMSTTKFGENYTFSESDEVNVQDIPWPRSFRPYIVFCETNKCEPGAIYPATTEEEVLIYVGPRGPPGPPGPPGVPGPPGNLQGGFDFVGKLDCDVPDVVKEVAKQNQRIQGVEEKINTMLQTVDSIYNSNFITGICPVGSKSGEFGLGSCYVIVPVLRSMAGAEIDCREKYKGHLVKIDNEKEEDFLTKEILEKRSAFTPERNGTQIRFITSGMFSFRGQPGWYWYHEPKSRDSFKYTHWDPSFEPIPERSTKVCMALTINPKETTSVWTVVDCRFFYYYICEIPKRCL